MERTTNEIENGERTTNTHRNTNRNPGPKTEQKENECPVTKNSPKSDKNRKKLSLLKYIFDIQFSLVILFIYIYSNFYELNNLK